MPKVIFDTGDDELDRATEERAREEDLIPGEGKTIPQTLRLEEQVAIDLKKRAAELRCSMSELANECIKEWLVKEND